MTRQSLGSIINSITSTARLVRSVTSYKVHKLSGRIKYALPETLVIEPEVDAFVRRIEGDAGGYVIGWRQSSAPARVYAGPSPDQIDHAQPLADLASTNQTVITDAQIRGVIGDCARPYFEISFYDGRRLIVAERVLPLQGGINFRDIGGYRTTDGRHTRWGLVYRSGGMDSLTVDDLNYLHCLGLRTVCDLRTSAEASVYHDRLPDADVNYVHNPILTDEDSAGGIRVFLFNLRRLEEMVIHSYTHQMIDTKAPRFGAVLRRMATPGTLPALFHCSAGKDRTGITAMLLLSTLGVPEDTIIADYSISNHYYQVIRNGLAGSLNRLRVLRLTADDLTPMLTANPATLRAALAHINAVHGSVEKYLLGPAGLDRGVLDTLRQTLLQ